MRIHCSGPNFTQIIYAISKISWCDTYLQLYTGGMCVQGGLYRLTGISCHVRWVVSKFSHDLDHLDVQYRGVHIDCNL